jgi:hypothetical protein
MTEDKTATQGKGERDQVGDGKVEPTTGEETVGWRSKKTWINE